MKRDELVKQLSDMVKDTKTGKIRWEVKCQTTEYNDADTKPDKFAGVVKAVGADAEPEFESTRIIDNFVAGRVSIKRPHATSANASHKRATKNSIPTVAALIWKISV